MRKLAPAALPVADFIAVPSAAAAGSNTRHQRRGPGAHAPCAPARACGLLRGVRVANSAAHGGLQRRRAHRSVPRRMAGARRRQTLQQPVHGLARLAKRAMMQAGTMPARPRAAPGRRLDAGRPTGDGPPRAERRSALGTPAPAAGCGLRAGPAASAGYA
jgi:hypothetical protein